MLFISNAYAQEAAAAPDLLANIIPLVVIFAIFYFLLIRPQQNKMKAHDAMITGLKRGDKLVTGGGILGTITKVDDSSKILHVEIAPDVIVRINRSTVIEVLDKTDKEDNKTSSVGKKNRKK